MGLKRREKMAQDKFFYRNASLIFRITWICLIVLTAWVFYSMYRHYIVIPGEVRNLYTALHLRFKPSGTVGHCLGILGSIFMFFSYAVYILRKKIEWLECWGPLSMWLDVHIFFGTLGIVFVIFHSALALRGLIGVGFWIMIIVLITGIFGRLLFSYCFCGISILHELMHKIDFFIEKDLKNASKDSPIIKKTIDLKAPGFPSSSGLITIFLEWRSIKEETDYLLDILNKKCGGYQDQDICQWAEQLIKRLKEIRSTAILNLSLSLLSKWRVIHKVSSYLLFFISMAHAVVTLYWGYSWIL